MVKARSGNALRDSSTDCGGNSSTHVRHVSDRHVRHVSDRHVRHVIDSHVRHVRGRSLAVNVIDLTLETSLRLQRNSLRIRRK